MVTIMGNYSEEAITDAKFHLRFTFPSSSFAGQWKNVSLTANYLASFFETFFQSANPLSPPYSLRFVQEIQSSISYIANELIENAVKFNIDESIEVGLAVYSEESQLIFLVWNSIDERCARRLQSLIQKIIFGDVEELLIQRMEENFLNCDNTPNSSGLGLLTIMQDHGAKLGWHFENVAGKRGLKLLTTMVSLPLVNSAELVEV